MRHSSNWARDTRLNEFGKEVASAAKIIGEVPLLAPYARDLAEIGIDSCAPCRIAIAGVFNAGKSTLLNALLGCRILKDDVLPANAAVVALEHSDKPYLTGHRADGSFQGFEPDRFEQLIFESDSVSANTRMSFTHFSVGITHPLLRDLVLVDTPGLGALHGFHGRATRSFLHRTDALIWVTPVTEAGSASELRAIAEIGKPIDLLVVNRMDAFDPEEQNESAEQAVERIARHFGQPPETTVGISAKLAFRGKTESRGDLLARSNWSAFEQLLTGVILSNVAHSKRRVICRRACDAFDSMGKKLLEAVSELQSERDQIAKGWEDAVRKRKSLLSEQHCWRESSSGVADRVLRTKVQHLSPGVRAEIDKLVRSLDDNRDQYRKLKKERQDEDNREAELNSRQSSIHSRRRAYQEMSFFDRLADRLFGETKERIEQDEANLREDRDRWDRRKRELDDELTRTRIRVTNLERDAQELLERGRSELRAALETNRQDLARLRRNRRVWRLRLVYRRPLMLAASQLLEQLGQLDKAGTLAFGDLKELDGLLEGLRGCYAACEAMREMRPARRTKKLVEASEAVLVNRIQTHASGWWHSTGDIVDLIQSGYGDMPFEAVASTLEMLAAESTEVQLRFAASISMLRLRGDDPQLAETVGLIMGEWPSSPQEYGQVLEMLPERATQSRERLLHAGVRVNASLSPFVLKATARGSVAYHMALISIGQGLLVRLTIANRGILQNG